MKQTLSVDVEDIIQIKRDIELLKNVLLSEGELSDWAKKTLIEARKESEGDYVSLEDL